MGATFTPILLAVSLRGSRNEKLNNLVFKNSNKIHAKRLDHVEDRISELEAR
jgi:hypothetical protein